MLEKVQQDRTKKLHAIRELGVDPYGGRYEDAEPIAEILERHKLDDEGHSTPGQRGRAAGRLVLMRDMGKMIFAHLRDSTGQMQIALRKPKDPDAADALSETEWTLAKLLDLGDLVGVEGPIQKTRTGEITIWAGELKLLCKSLLPMPEKFHGLQDVETRYRRRYLDLMTNPDSMGVFKRRVGIIDTIRDLLKQRGYLEVETPMLQHIYGGAAARPFTTHHNALDCDLFLRISPETYLKRLLVGGLEKVFEINRNFRNEGLSTRHNPEFTMIELYEAYADYHVMMDIAEQLISEAAKRANDGATKISYGELEIDFTPPFRRAKYADLLREHAGVSMDDIPAVRAKARELGLTETKMADVVVINEVFEATVEQHLVQPTFVCDYPAALCPLTRRDPDNPEMALRFELFVANMELANAYTELNDPAIQDANFREQVAGEEGETMRVMDEDFITALRHGMPPAGGMGIGIDRLVMLLTDTHSIRDVLFFPMLRPETHRPAETTPDVVEQADAE
jgi:lysyl-tRNA synthetase class 2